MVAHASRIGDVGQNLMRFANPKNHYRHELRLCLHYVEIGKLLPRQFGIKRGAVVAQMMVQASAQSEFCDLVSCLIFSSLDVDTSDGPDFRHVPMQIPLHRRGGRRSLTGWLRVVAGLTH